MAEMRLSIETHRTTETYRRNFSRAGKGSPITSRYKKQVRVHLRGFWFAMGLLCATWIAAGAQRLPGGVKPVHYALTITPDLAKARFAGSERIEVVLDRPTKTITLNAAEIEFVSVQGWVGTNANAGILRSAQNDKLSGGDASRATNANAGVLPLRAARFGRDDGSARGWQNPQGGAGRAANTNTARAQSSAERSSRWPAACSTPISSSSASSTRWA